MTTATLVYRKVSSISLPAINWKMVFVSTFIMLAGFLVFYVFQINCLIRGSYLIGDYENKIYKLSSENKSLEVIFAQNDYLSGLDSRAKELNFERTKQIKYIQISESQVASAGQANIR